MDKEEYYKRIERINNRFKNDRVSADEEYQLVCQKNYLSTKYIERLEQQCKKQKEVIDKEIEYLTSYSSIHTIQFGTENDSLNDIELNKTLDEKTLNEMTNRYLKVHDKLLEILEKVSE